MMIGVVGKMITELKDITRDWESPYLWEDWEWVSYLNDGQSEICRRGMVLSGVESITIAHASATYSCSSKIIDVSEKAYFNYDNSFLTKRTSEWLDTNKTSWRSDSGTPTDFILDANNYTVTLTPTPTSTYNGYVVSFSVKKLPTTVLSMDNTTPSIDSRYYEDMKKYALYRAYSKMDTETYDDKRALQYLQEFTASIGVNSNINVERIFREEPSTLRIQVRR